MSSIIDDRVFADLRECTNDTLLKEIVDIFVADVPNRVNQLRTAIAYEDKPGFLVAANSIKGSALVIGAVELQRKAEILETTGRQAGIAGLEPMLPTLVRSFTEAANELQRMVAA